MEKSPSHRDLEEVHFLISKFLSMGPLTQTYQTMLKELEEHNMIPDRTNWLGQPVKQNYQQYSSTLSHVQPNHLEVILQQFLSVVRQRENLTAGISKSLLSKRLIQSEYGDPSAYPPKLTSLISRRTGHSSVTKWGNGIPINAVHSFVTREHVGTSMGVERIHSNFYSKRLKLAKRSVGHLSAVYCVLYDMTGKYIFTGADDKLVKVWSAVNGRLIATLRGAQGEITDMAVSHENTLLAVGSNDKLIRIWSLPNCASLAVLNAHAGQITSVFFCPMPGSLCSIRYLASTATDGSCAFWAYSENPGEEAVFQPKPTLYQERMRPGHAHILCASFSPGGVFMAAGSADNNVRVYYMLCPEGPQRILEVECHKDRVDSISWAHKGLRFISGSKDGTALIYRYEYQHWRYTRINCTKGLPGEPPVIIDDPKKRPRVTMVAWNKDDTYCLTATSDFLVKVWNSQTGNIVRVMKAHTEEVYILEPHPLNPNYICTAGHDGLIIVWDIGPKEKEDYHAVKIFEHLNMIEGAGHGSIFDCKFSPDGLGLAATDSHGHILIFGYGFDESKAKSRFDDLPSELFFHTDYRPFLSLATTPEVFDEQTQLLTHQMPPPFLVDIEGNPYPPEFQRLVPGRENCNTEQLVPVVAVFPGGRREVIEGLNHGRSNIDNMIEELAARNPLNAQARADGGYRLGYANEAPQIVGNLSAVVEPEPGPSASTDESAASSSTIARTSSKEITVIRRKAIVQPLPQGILRVSDLQRLVDGEEEEEYYQLHFKKTPPGGMLHPHPLASPTLSPSSRFGRVRRPRRVEPAYFQPQRMDHDEDEVEGVARPNPPQMEISVSQESPRRPQAPPRSNSAQNGARQPRRVRYDVRRILEENGTDNIEDIPSPEASDSDSVDEPSESEPSSESEEESDEEWGAGTRSREEAATEGSRSSKRNRRQRDSSSEGEAAPKPAKVRKRATIEESPDTAEPRPGPSSEISSVVKVEAKAKSKKQKRVVADECGLEEIPEQYRPPEWLSEVMPRRSPYFPQLGDELVYCRQGHELYIKYVESAKLYEVTKKAKKQLPYEMNPDLPTEVPVRLVKIDFILAPPRLVNLKLEVMDWETGELTGETLNVKYHDVPSVPDFLILRQVYDRSLRHRWNPGDKFRSMIDTKWWIGCVQEHWPTNPKFPNSKFMSYSIQWDSESDVDILSPWDMEIITDDFVIPDDIKDGIPIAIEDLRNPLYEVRPQDWEPHGHQDAECARISALIERVMALSIAEAFLTPVDLNHYPDYAMEIEYLIDLSTIKARLDNLFYRRSRAIVTDIEHIAINAEKYNQANALIVRNAKVIRDLLKDIVNNPNFGNVNEEYRAIAERYDSEAKKPKKTLKTRKPNSSNHGSSPDGSSNHGSDLEDASDASEPGPSTSTGSRTFNARVSRQREQRTRGGNRRYGTHEEDKDRYSSSDWRQNCRKLLDVLWKEEDAIHFRHPVNLLEYPDYTTVVDTPMSLSNIREELRGGNYETPIAFDKDVKLIFSNSKSYNTDSRSQIRCMTLRLQGKYENEYKLVLEKWKRSKSRQKPASTPNKSRSNGRVTSTSRSSDQPGTSRSFSSRGSGRVVNGKSKQLEATSSRLQASSNNSPRKCPTRLAAQKNPFIGNKSSGIAGTSSPRKALSQGVSQFRNGSSSGRPQRRGRSVSTGATRNSRNGRSRNTPSDSEMPGPSSSVSRPQRVRRRISSGESSGSLVNGKETPSPCSSNAQNRNGTKQQSHDESDEAPGRYSLRNKIKSPRGESSSPERSNPNQRSLRKRNPIRRILQDSDSEPEDMHTDEAEAEKENNPVDASGDSDGSNHDEACENDDQSVVMPTLKRDVDEDELGMEHSDVNDDDDDDSEFEGDEEDGRSSVSHLSTTPENGLRRSSRKATKKKFADEDSDEEVSINVRPTNRGSGRRATRNKGKHDKNYAENSDSDY